MKCILWALAACCIFVGGATVVSGSNRSSSRQSQNHPISQQYLFFLSQDASQTVSMVQLGKDGIFKVNDDGGLENIASSKGGAKEQSLRRVKSAIEQDMERLHGNSLTQLNANIKKK